jgi:predicted MFS family arabinose efflux permease
VRFPTFRWVFVAFALGNLGAVFLRSANAVIAPDLMRDIGLNAEQLGSMTSFYYITFALMQLPLGAALDRYGSRFVIPVLMIPAIIGCLVYARATSYPEVAAGRLLIGVGTAGGLMGAVRTFGNWVPANRLSTMTTSMMALGGIGGIMTTSPMAWVNAQYGWQNIFYGSAGIVTIIALCIWAWTRDFPPSSTIIRSTGNPFEGFVAIYTNAAFWRMAPLYFSMLGTLLAVQTLWAGPFLYDVLSYSAVQAGSALLMMGIGAILGYACSGPLADRYGAPWMLVAAQVLLIVTLAVFVGTPHIPSQGLVALLYLCFSLGAAFNVILLPQARTLFAVQMSGRAATALNIFGFIGAFFFQRSMGYVIEFHGRDAAGQYLTIGYQWAFAIPLVCAVGALLNYLPLVFATQKKGLHDA